MYWCSDPATVRQSISGVSSMLSREEESVATAASAVERPRWCRMDNRDGAAEESRARDAVLGSVKAALDGVRAARLTAVSAARAEACLLLGMVPVPGPWSRCGAA